MSEIVGLGEAPNALRIGWDDISCSLAGRAEVGGAWPVWKWSWPPGDVEVHCTEHSRSKR